MRQGENEKETWIKHSINGATLYSQFLGNAEIDGSPKAVGIVADSPESIRLIIPHFWNYAAIDPSTPFYLFFSFSFLFLFSFIFYLFTLFFFFLGYSILVDNEPGKCEKLHGVGAIIVISFKWLQLLLFIIIILFELKVGSNLCVSSRVRHYCYYCSDCVEYETKRENIEETF